MRRCVARCSSLLPAHSGSAQRYVRGAAARTRRYVRGAVRASMRARGAVQATSRTRGAVRALSSTTRGAALERLGCTEASSREAIRDAYYRLAKACHPDQGGSAAEFRALAAAYETALRGDEDWLSTDGAGFVMKTCSVVVDDITRASGRAMGSSNCLTLEDFTSNGASGKSSPGTGGVVVLRDSSVARAMPSSQARHANHHYHHHRKANRKITRA